MQRTQAVHVFSCPKLELGRSLVRFLGDPRGILVHYVGKKPHACPGEDACKHHRTAPRWKGYAPGQLWLPERGLWIPVVVEMTEGLTEFTGVQGLRGQCWEIFRAHRSYGDKAIEGLHVRDYNSFDVPKAFCVVRTIERLYNTIGIVWDVPHDNWTRTRAECSNDAPEQPAEQPAEKPAELADAKANYRDMRNRLFKMPTNGEQKKT